MTSDKERNRLTARVQRYGRVGANVGGVAARIASTRCSGSIQTATRRQPLLPRRLAV